MENRPDNLQNVIGTEEHLAIRWENNKWVECGWDEADFRGKVDILSISGERATFIDHKTQPFVETADTYQMGFYAWMIKVHYPKVKIVESILHFASPEINYFSEPYGWTEDDISNIETQSRLNVSAIESLESFPEVPNYYCKYCPLLLSCTVAKDFYSKKSAYGKLKNAPVRSATEAVELAETLTVVDEGRSMLNSRLQKFIKEIGPVQIRGKEYSYKTSEKYEPKSDADKEAIAEIIRGVGLNPMTYFNIDQSELKKIWRFLSKEDLEKVKSHLKLVKSSVFGGRKT